jgi:aerobic-type carbon monoxide dehydrogenase small subunit (CoxS/CutS family)
MVKLTINGEPKSLDAGPDMPLVRMFGDILDLTGTEFGRVLRNAAHPSRHCECSQ